MGGASEFENRYGRLRWRSSSHDLAPARGVAARGAAERLAQRAGDDVHAPRHAAVLGRAAPACADHADRVRIVDHHQRIEARGDVADRVEARDDAVHREHAVGGDQLEARAVGIGLAQLALEILEVVVGVAVAPRLAEADAVDDRGVVQRVGDHRVLLAEDGLEQAAVGVEARGIQDRVLGAEEGAQPLLQLAVQRLRAADEAHRGHAEAEAFQPLARGGDQRGMVREPEVVVGAEVDRPRPPPATRITASCGVAIWRSCLVRPSRSICASSPAR